MFYFDLTYEEKAILMLLLYYGFEKMFEKMVLEVLSFVNVDFLDFDIFFRLMFKINIIFGAIPYRFGLIFKGL